MAETKRKSRGKKINKYSLDEKAVASTDAQNFTYFNLRVGLELCFKTSDVLSFLQTLSI